MVWDQTGEMGHRREIYILQSLVEGVSEENRKGWTRGDPGVTFGEKRVSVLTPLRTTGSGPYKVPELVTLTVSTGTPGEEVKTSLYIPIPSRYKESLELR